MSRPLLEQTVRRRVESLGNVVIRDETAAEGYQGVPVPLVHDGRRQTFVSQLATKSLVRER